MELIGYLVVIGGLSFIAYEAGLISRALLKLHEMGTITLSEERIARLRAKLDE